jgi:hypothetical protein
MSSPVAVRTLGAALAIFVSYNAVLSLGFGLFGSQGNSIITGLILAGLLVSILSLSVRYFDGLLPIDLLFAGLIIAVAVSTIANHRSEGSKELLLLAATFAAYVVCRSISGDALHALLPAFKRTTAVIVGIGAFFTAATVLSQSDITTGKPAVLGFEALPAQLMMSLSFLILGLVTSESPTPRRTLLISALIFVPVAIFAAAMVRFAFVALVISLFLAMILQAGKRWHVIAVAITVMVSVGVGLSARANAAKSYAGHLVEVASKPSVAEGASAAEKCESVNRSNSIDIRKFLAEEAVHMIPAAGLVGLGLDSFMKATCLGHQVHNSILQMTVEFGWFGGSLFVLLQLISVIALVPAARCDSSARFVLCSLVFSVLISLAHGRISRDIVLFMFLGCSAGVSRCRIQL